MNGPTLSHISYLDTVSKWQYTLNEEYAGRLCAIEPYRNPEAPKYILTWYLPLMGEVWLKEKPALNELKGPTLFPVALYSPKFKAASSGSVFSLEMPQNRKTLWFPRSLMVIGVTTNAEA